MKIGYDIRSFLSNETGIGIYFKNLVNQIITSYDHRYYLLSASLKKRFDKRKLKLNSNVVLKDKRIPVSLLDLLWYRAKLLPFGFFFRQSMDLVHSPVPSLIPGRHKQIITVHDLCLVDSPELVNQDTISNFQHDLHESIEKANGIVAVSEFTKDRILSNFGNQYQSKIKVIYHGSDLDDIEETMPESSQPLPEKYLLYVGTIEPRKNISVLLRAIDDILGEHPDLKLLVCGNKGWESDQTYRLLEQKIIEKKVIHLPYSNRASLKYLYRNASLLLFPSIYEGFGLPILEAAHCGTSVACSDIPVFREIFKEFPIYFDHMDPIDIADKINTFLNSPDMAAKKLKLGKDLASRFSWSKCGQQTMRFYEETIDENRS